MYDADPTVPAGQLDGLFIDTRPASLEPVHPMRPGGDVCDVPMLGRMEFFPMPHGRPSFWLGEQKMPDSRYSLQIACEVEGDDLPGSDQAACVTAFRRMQVQDAVLCAPLINERLAELRIAGSVTADDLVMTMIHLSPRPLTDARFELGFRSAAFPSLTFTVVFLRGAPRAVRVDTDL